MTRERLPSRRPHVTLNFSHGGFAYAAGIGRFDDGRLAEIFLSSTKIGTAVEAVARDSAILCSLCLQAGVPVQTIRHALSRDHAGAPATPLARLLDILAEEGAT